MIYRYTLVATHFEIAERRVLRRETISTRYNRYTLANSTHNHFALLATCAQIRDEIQHSGVLDELSFEITSTKALEGSLGYRLGFPGMEQDKIDDQILALLQRAKGVEIHIEERIGRRDVPVFTVGWLGATLEVPQKIKLVDSSSNEDLPGRFLDDAVVRWKRFAQTL
jgi:hypothetical protein